MEIKKLFERDGVDNAEGVRRQKISAYQEQVAGKDASVQKEEDRVSISPMYRQLSQISKIVAEDDQQQQQRVADIKARVEAGTYAVDSRAVAQSMVSFAADTKDIP